MDAPELPGLVDGRVSDLGERADLSGLRFAGLDLSERDLTGSRLVECELSDVVLEDAKLTAVRLIDCRLENLDVPVLLAARPMWRNVSLRASRVGSAELYDGEWASVLVTGCRLGYLNFRHSTLTDVELNGCRISELDLSGATATQVRFVDCDVETLTIGGARLKDVDLRGARISAISGISAMSGTVIDETQLVELAPLLAAEAGISVQS
ncbi:MAG: pentapeptide repeat-containing protein [Actinomycetales bacterium]